MKRLVDLSGNKYGMLTVKRMLVARPYTKKSYECVCDCGNVCTRLESSLVQGRKSSCGCYTRSFLTVGDSERCSKAGKHRKNSFVDGSNIQMTLRPGTITTNTSGVQGVSWSGSACKWHVYVGYQNYRANLGFYDDLETAKMVRQKAEESISDGTFEDFYYAIRGYRLGEKQHKQYKKRG